MTPDLPELLRARWPNLSHEEMVRGIVIAIECTLPPIATTGRLPEPEIFDMCLVEPRPNEAGIVLIARFNGRVGGMLLLGSKLLGLKLLRKPDGSLSVSNVVSGSGRATKTRGAVIEDEGLRAVVLAAAAATLDGTPPFDGKAPRRHRGRRAAEPMTPDERAACLAALEAAERAAQALHAVLGD